MNDEKITNPCPVCWHNTVEPVIDLKVAETVVDLCHRCGFAGYARCDLLPLDKLNEILQAKGCTLAQPLSFKERRQNLSVFVNAFGDIPREQKAEYLGLNSESPDELHVRILVRGGVAYVEDCPAGVKVEIVDHDNTKGDTE